MIGWQHAFFFNQCTRCQHWSTRPQYWSTWRSGKLSGSYMKLRIEVDQGWSILSGCSLRNAYRSPTTQSYEVGRTLVFEQATSICKQNGLNQTERHSEQPASGPIEFNRVELLSLIFFDPFWASLALTLGMVWYVWSILRDLHLLTMFGDETGRASPPWRRPDLTASDQPDIEIYRDISKYSIYQYIKIKLKPKPPAYVGPAGLRCCQHLLSRWHHMMSHDVTMSWNLSWTGSICSMAMHGQIWSCCGPLEHMSHVSVSFQSQE